MLRQLVPAALIIAAAAGAAPAQTSFPMVTHCTPVAVQRGTTAEVTVEGQMNFAGARGRELAANDDTFFADPYLAFTAPAAGDYFLQVRDSKYDGDPRWAYALLVTTKPYVAHVHPFAANPGQQLQVETVGSASRV